MRKRVKKLLHNDEKCVTIKALYVNLLLGGIRIMATFYASKTGEVSAREKEHSALVRELAGECMTLQFERRNPAACRCRKSRSLW